MELEVEIEHVQINASQAQKNVSTSGVKEVFLLTESHESGIL